MNKRFKIIHRLRFTAYDGFYTLKILFHLFTLRINELITISDYECLINNLRLY